MIHFLKNFKIFEFNSFSFSLIAIFSSLSAILGLYHYEASWLGFLITLLSYFTYTIIGINIAFHRQLSHKSFYFKYKFIEYLFTFFGILAGRGSPLAWTYIHREHHQTAGSKNDPHPSGRLTLRNIIFPQPQDTKTLDKKLVKDLFTRSHLLINRFYMLIIGTWIGLLISIDPWIFVFAWAIPVFVSNIIINSFSLLGHRVGYENFHRPDNSKNSWIFSVLLLGEGWHNNHHQNPRSYTTKFNWWEFDLTGFCITLVKK